MDKIGDEVRIEPLSVSQVVDESLDLVWDELLPMIKKGLSKGAGDRTTPELIKAAISLGGMNMWVIHDGPEIVAGVIVSVRQHPTMRTVFVELTAGRDLHLWIDEIEKLLRTYKELSGSDAIEASCRSGLAEILSKRGWNRKATLMELK